MVTTFSFSSCQLCCNRVFSVATRFLRVLSNFCCDKKLLGRNIFFFSNSYSLLSCVLGHRNICCDTYFLSKSQFFFNFCRNLILFYRDRILLFHSFYCRDRKFICSDRDSAFNSSLCSNMIFFVATPLVFLFSPLLR